MFFYSVVYLYYCYFNSSASNTTPHDFSLGIVVCHIGVILDLDVSHNDWQAFGPNTDLIFVHIPKASCDVLQKP